jgi:hypothetical protein
MKFAAIIAALALTASAALAGGSDQLSSNVCEPLHTSLLVQKMMGWSKDHL